MSAGGTKQILDPVPKMKLQFLSGPDSIHVSISIYLNLS